MLKLKELLGEYSDEELARQFKYYKDQYTEQALELMKQEIEKRNLDIDSLISQTDSSAKDSLAEFSTGYAPEEFGLVGESFSRSDILLINAIFREHNIPFYVKATESDAAEGQETGMFSLFVHNGSQSEASEALSEHFTFENGCYRLKYTDTKDQLKVFSFHDVHLDEKSAAEELEVSFSPQETAVVAAFAKRLLDEADEVEEQQQRVLFYYDSIEPLLEKLEKDDSKFCRTDLLTILEICQVYCDSPDFPESTDEMISSLLAFFLN